MYYDRLNGDTHFQFMAHTLQYSNMAGLKTELACLSIWVPFFSLPLLPVTVYLVKGTNQVSKPGKYLLGATNIVINIQMRSPGIR